MQPPLIPNNSAGLIDNSGGFSEADRDRLKLTSTKLDTLEINSNIIELIEFSRGGWFADINNNQMVMLNEDGSELTRFNCYDENNNPSMSNIRRMIPVQES